MGLQVLPAFPLATAGFVLLEHRRGAEFTSSARLMEETRLSGQ